jgi:hypothetical protein
MLLTGWFWVDNKKEYTNSFNLDYFLASEYTKIFNSRENAIQYAGWLILRGFKHFVVRELGS